MANTEMIREYIRASGYKLQYVARAMQISPNALGQKLQGHTQFKLNEAERLSAVLGLSMYERDLCFFEEQNWRCIGTGCGRGRAIRWNTAGALRSKRA